MFNEKNLKLFFISIIVLKIIIILMIVYKAPIVMDEFWQGSTILYKDEGFYKFVLVTKTLLYAYFYQISHWLFDSSWAIVFSERIQNVCISSLGLMVLYKLLRNSGFSSLYSLFVIAITLSITTYDERIFRIRAEPIALFFAITSLYIITLDPRKFTLIFISGLLTGLAFLSTQKAIYFNVALGVALISTYNFKKNLTLPFISAGILLLGWFCTLVIYAASFDLNNVSGVMGDILFSPLELAVNGGEYYSNLHDFIFDTLRENIYIYTLSFSGMLVGIFKIKKLSKQKQIIFIFSICVSLFVFNHNQPWPYIFIWSAPFVAILTIIPIELFKSTKIISYEKHILALSVMIASFSFIYNINYLQLNNKAQRSVLEIAESLLLPDERYFDGIGMIVTHKQSSRLWWDSDSIRKIKALEPKQQNETISGVFDVKHPPKLLIWNYRFDSLNENISTFINNSFVKLYPNIYVTGMINSGNFINRWPGKYAIYNQQGEQVNSGIYINGQLHKEPVFLAKGRYNISIINVHKDDKNLYLLPFNLKRIPKLEPNPSNISLYLRKSIYG